MPAGARLAVCRKRKASRRAGASIFYLFTFYCVTSLASSSKISSEISFVFQPGESDAPPGFDIRSAAAFLESAISYSTCSHSQPKAAHDTRVQIAQLTAL